MNYIQDVNEDSQRKIVEQSIYLPCTNSDIERRKIISNLMIKLRTLLGDACTQINRELDLSLPPSCCIQKVIDNLKISITFIKDPKLDNQVKAKIEIFLTQSIEKPTNTPPCFGASTLKHPQLIDPLSIIVDPRTADPLDLLSKYVKACQGD
ncbi:hypothetical protein [Chroococcus sp. FPU101]|uniref:hypothetical protein n=1 Tax=Chroococcus sp. FPU101 TaxID=1974212 RepID=UPI001A8F7EFF|nr:hypothetical protein [Chroococcus sp. FPU101]GFE68757.1 hypothetical protein CFPU101_13670 [Chroococcus sp. FPU101]